MLLFLFYTEIDTNKNTKNEKKRIEGTDRQTDRQKGRQSINGCGFNDSGVTFNNNPSL